MGEAKLTTRWTWRIKLLMAFFVVFSAVSFNSVFNAQDSFAAYCDPGRYSCNGPETGARNICYEGGASGAMWFNTTSGAATDDGYYAATVNVNATANSVGVNLRGSVNSCDDAGSYNVYAVGIAPTGGEGWRLTGLSSTTLFRGTMPGSYYRWSSQGSGVNATLNVTGLAANNLGKTDSQSITIDIYRCFSTNGSSATGSCYATPVIVNVFRAANYNFTLTPTITGTPASTSGDTDGAVDASLQPSINNTGTTQTSPNVQWQIVNFVIPPGGTVPPGTDTSVATPPVSYFGNGATIIGQAGGQTLQRNVTNLSIADQVIGDHPFGTQVCYALSVQPITQSNDGWRHSTPFCVRIGKSPKVQILGNDLITGRNFIGVSTPAPTSRVQTSITKQASKSVTVTAPQSAFGGLFNTGVNASKQQLAAGTPDPHWVIDRVIRTPGKGGDTCQEGTNAAGTALIKYPTTSANPAIPARTVMQNPAGSMAGLYTSDNQNVTGIPNSTVINYNGQFVWSRTSNNAKWIGQNVYGQNYSKSSCYDPTFNTPSDMDNANVYVFKLKDGFTIDPAARVDLDNAKIKITGGVDNQVKFFVNGQELPGGWQTPGWAAGSSATSTSKAGVFNNGNNSLEIWVRSTGSHTGLLIDELRIEATAQVPVATNFGSWVEYAILPTGTVTGTGSASAFAGGVPTLSYCGRTSLTFANTTTTNPCTNSSTLGSYKTGKTIPDIAGYFPTSSSTTTLAASRSLTNLVSGTYKAPNNFEITGGSIPAGRSIVINAPNSTVTISSNITYTTGDISSPSLAPQVVIIAKDINITGGVSTVDAWLVTKGTLNTCSDVAAMTSLQSGVCQTVLTVNGPVQAGKLELWRTGGAGNGADAGNPAEIFNFRPDTYLWGLSQTTKSGRLESVYEQELPPRF